MTRGHSNLTWALREMYIMRYSFPKVADALLRIVDLIYTLPAMQVQNMTPQQHTDALTGAVEFGSAHLEAIMEHARVQAIAGNPNVLRSTLLLLGCERTGGSEATSRPTRELVSRFVMRGGPQYVQTALEAIAKELARRAAAGGDVDAAGRYSNGNAVVMWALEGATQGVEEVVCRCVHVLRRCASAIQDLTEEQTSSTPSQSREGLSQAWGAWRKFVSVGGEWGRWCCVAGLLMVVVFLSL